jgi:hypothetical protein
MKLLDHLRRRDPDIPDYSDMPKLIARMQADAERQLKTDKLDEEMRRFAEGAQAIGMAAGGAAADLEAAFQRAGLALGRAATIPLGTRKGKGDV